MRTNQLVILFILLLFSLNSCKKNEDADFLLQNEWKIKSIFTNKETLKPQKKTHREEAYILKFNNDTFFDLHTSVNYAGGRCNIVFEGKICIENYGIQTKVCCENDFDKQMISIMNNVNSYHCKGNKLTFLTDKNEKIIFEKQ